MFNLVTGHRKGLFCIWAGILEDIHVLTSKKPSCACIPSEFRLLQLTNSACPSGSNLEPFLRNTISVLIHPVPMVHHGCRGCWQGRGCCTTHKGEGPSPHQGYCSPEQAQKDTWAQKQAFTLGRFSLTLTFRVNTTVFQQILPQQHHPEPPWNKV